MKIKLFDKQMEAWKALNQEAEVEMVLYGGQANSGKSYLGAIWILTHALTYSGIVIGLCRKNLKTLKTTSLKTFYKVCNEYGIKKNIHFKFNEVSNIITFNNGKDKDGNFTGYTNGSEIHLINLEWRPSDPDADFLGGLELTMALVEELPEIHQTYYETLYSRIRYKLDEFKLNKKILATCNPSNGWVKGYFYDRYVKNTLPNKIKFISTVGGNNPHRGKDYEKKLSLMSEQKYKRLELGDWEYASTIDQLFTHEKIDIIFSDIITEKQKDMKFFISADVARFGKDSSVIVVWHGMRIIKIVKLNKSSIVDTAMIIKELANKYNVPRGNIIADSDGVGGGIVDILGCKGFMNGSKPLNNEKYDMLKTQMYFALVKKDWSIAEDISQADKDQIKKELQAIRDCSDEFKYKINTKDEQKRILNNSSPDYSDAIMMRMYFTYVSTTIKFDVV